MGRVPYLPALTFLATTLLSGMVVYGSLGYLGGLVYEAAANSAGAIDRQRPNFVAGIEPLPSGSVNAIAAIPDRDTRPPNTISADLTVRHDDASIAPLAASTPAIADVTPTGHDLAAASPDAQIGDAAANGQRLMIVTSAVNLRDRPSNNSRVVATVSRGTQMAAVAERQGWVQVNGGGRSGWIYQRFLRPAN